MKFACLETCPALKYCASSAVFYDEMAASSARASAHITDLRLDATANEVGSAELADCHSGSEASDILQRVSEAAAEVSELLADIDDSGLFDGNASQDEHLAAGARNDMADIQAACPEGASRDAAHVAQASGELVCASGLSYARVALSLYRQEH